MNAKKVVFNDSIREWIDTKKCRIAYHTFGKLNQSKNNVVWICHALTANSNLFEWCSENLFWLLFYNHSKSNILVISKK